MNASLRYRRFTRLAGLTIILTGVLSVPLIAQTATSTSQARQIIEARRAIFTLIGANFRPLGAVLKGEKPYDAADAEKRVARIVFLSALLDEAFPEGSNIGLPDTKAKAEAWSNHEDFVRKLQEFQANASALQKVNLAEKAASDNFKTALNTVAQSCKGCHDTYKEK